MARKKYEQQKIKRKKDKKGKKRKVRNVLLKISWLLNIYNVMAYLVFEEKQRYINNLYQKIRTKANSQAILKMILKSPAPLCTIYVGVGWNNTRLE